MPAGLHTVHEVQERQVDPSGRGELLDERRQLDAAVRERPAVLNIGPLRVSEWQLVERERLRARADHRGIGRAGGARAPDPEIYGRSLSGRTALRMRRASRRSADGEEEQQTRNEWLGHVAPAIKGGAK
jgi:hypothetical protein